MERQREQYLQRYAESEAREVPHPSRAFSCVAVVPALGEGDSLDRAVASIRRAGGGAALTIVVLNARASDSAGVHAANAAARTRLLDAGARFFAAPPGGAARDQPGSAAETSQAARDAGGRLDADLLVIDRAGPGRWIPEKEGVGLARKIGSDVAVAFRAAGRVAGRWIHHTDADARVPADWFARGQAAPADTAALTFPFRHEADDATAEHVALYELWLRYHRLGLAAAGSPYAFQAIGSTMVVDAAAYVLVRGWPRTMAGEDFYLLDKLAKFGAVRALSGAPVLLAGRASPRVPFGTGRALLDMAARGTTADEWRLMDPAAYAALGRVLAALSRGADAARPLSLAAELSDAPGVLDILVEMGLPAFLDRARALNLPTAVRRRRLHTWFDAFRTLRFLHALRDGARPPLPWRAALAAAPFLAPAPGMTTAAPGDLPVPGDPAAPADLPSPIASPAAWLARLQALDEATALVAGVPDTSARAKSSPMTD